MALDPERFARIGDVFSRARKLEPGARAVYLYEACGTDTELRVEVEELLAEDARGVEDAVDRALADDAPTQAPVVSGRLDAIGKYRIVGLCGSGGMGTVYEATQESPARRVAVKVVQADALRPDLLSRFRREAEILGRLDHPGIAQIFEAGEFEHGGHVRPYFAMEFVDGISVLEFAEKRQLPTSARIDLFVETCDAVQYAHEHGVVHRDLKPDNILVVEVSETRTRTSAIDGRPKILDFGVARLTDGSSDVTLNTVDGALLGSVAYMSPEQAAGARDTIDGRSDLYSLGVLLFELLTGALPYPVRDRPLAEALDTIRHTEPTPLANVAPGLAEDLGTIVEKCLQKESARRYDEVADLAHDLRAYRQHQPIKARPPSSWYQLRKFAQRNRALVGGVVASTVALMVGAIASLLFALQSSSNARTAEENQVRAERESYRSSLLAASALLDTDPQHARRILGEVPESHRGWEHRYLTSAVSALLLEFGEVAVREPGFQFARTTGDMYLLSDGKLVIARSAADEFTIWETRTGRALRSFTAPEAVTLFTVSDDGSALAAALASGRVAVADPQLDEPRWETWLTDTGEVDGVALAPDGTALALQGEGGVQVGAPGKWARHDPPCTRVAHLVSELEFTPDGDSVWLIGESLEELELTGARGAAEPIPSTQQHWTIAVSPNGRRIAAGQAYREVRVYDLDTGEMEFEFFGHSRGVRDVAFGGDERVLSVGADGTIRVWCLEEGELLTVIDAPGTVKAEFVDDDHVLSLTGGRLRLWTLANTRARELVGHEGRIFVPIFSGDGTLLATSAPWEGMRIWDPLETRPLRRLDTKGLWQFAFVRTGSELLDSVLYVSRESCVTDWTSGGRVPRVARRRGAALHYNGTSVGLRVDGGATEYEPGELEVFRIVHSAGSTGAGTPLFMDGEEVPLSPVDDLAQVDFGRHPKLTFGAMREYEFEGDIAEWIAFEGELTPEAGALVDAYLSARREGVNAEFPTLPGEPRVLLHFRAQRSALELGPDGVVRRWSAVNDPERALRYVGSYSAGVAFEPGGEAAPDQVSFSNGYTANHWLEAEFPEAREARAITVCCLGRIHENRCRNTLYFIGDIALPFADSGRDERVRKVGPTLSFSADGRLVATSYSGRDGGWFRARDASTGELLFLREGQYSGIDFHPDSRRVACGRVDGKVDVIDIEKGELVAQIEAHASECYDVAFSPDGARLASAGNDNSLRLWETEEFEQVLEFPGHKSYVRGVAWSPNGTMLVSVAGDYVVRVWDSVSREERYAQRLANRALEDEVRADVEAMRRDDPTGATKRIAERWSRDDLRRAAQRVLARLGH